MLIDFNALNGFAIIGYDYQIILLGREDLTFIKEKVTHGLGQAGPNCTTTLVI